MMMLATNSKTNRIEGFRNDPVGSYQMRLAQVDGRKATPQVKGKAGEGRGATIGIDTGE